MAKEVKLSFGSTDEQDNRAGTFLVYGKAKMGKTSLIGSLPEGKLIFVDIEGGRNRLKEMGKAHTYVSVKDVDQLREAYEQIRYGRWKDYPYVAVDSFSELQQYILNSFQSARKKELPELREHGDTASKMKEYFFKFRDLKEQGRVVILTALEMDVDEEQSDEQSEVAHHMGPLMQKNLARQLVGLVDSVGRVYISKKTGEHLVRFKPSAHYYAGSRYNGLNNYIGPLDFPAILKAAGIRTFKKGD